ncbi:hypothetical protein AB0E54_41460 [Amycolatopsis coloradensis]|uniref:hypothetical protein n=1 Tax=Amycolatopsis coloradensis TaxID=76021 RepID=UPI0033FA0397
MCTRTDLTPASAITGAGGGALDAADLAVLCQHLLRRAEVDKAARLQLDTPVSRSERGKSMAALAHTLGDGSWPEILSVLLRNPLLPDRPGVLHRAPGQVLVGALWPVHHSDHAGKQLENEHHEHTEHEVRKVRVSIRGKGAGLRRGLRRQ